MGKSLLLVWSVFLLFSCARNYQKELNNCIKQCQKECKDIIAVSSSKHFIIYKDDNAIWLNNLDDAAEKILYPEKKMVQKTYVFSWSKDAIPYVSSWITERKIDKKFFTEDITLKGKTGYVYPYSESNIELLDNDAIYFSYKSIDEDIRGGGKIINEWKFVYYFLNPDTLFVTEMQPKMKGNGCGEYTIKTFASNLSDAILSFDDDEIFPYHYGYNMGEGGYFNWIISLDNKGKVIDKSNTIIYSNDVYDKEIKYWLSDLTSKEQAINILKEINDTIDICKEREYINKLVKQSITMEQLSKEYRNKIIADRKYKGKTLILECRLLRIREDDYTSSGYKYCLIGDWNWMYGYTNDDTFIELSYPTTVIMKAVLTNVSNYHDYIFSNCELLAW